MLATSSPARRSWSDRIWRLQSDRGKLSRRLTANNRIPAGIKGWLLSDLLAVDLEIAMLADNPASLTSLDLWEAVVGGINWLLTDENRLTANFCGGYMALFAPETSEAQIRRFRRLAGP